MKKLVFIKNDPTPWRFEEVSERYGIKTKTLKSRAARCEKRKMHNGFWCPVFSDKDLVATRYARGGRPKGKHYEDKPKPSIKALDDRVREKFNNDKNMLKVKK